MLGRNRASSSAPPSAPAASLDGAVGRISASGLFATSAAGSGTPTAIAYTPYTFGYVKDGFLGAARPRNRILIATTKRQALERDRSIAHRMTTAPQYADFKGRALIGVFLVERSAAVAAPFPQLPGPPEVPV